MTVRGAGFFVGACILLVALVLAVVPFSFRLSLGPGHSVNLDCDPPVASAWTRGLKDHMALWAVTVGGNMGSEDVVVANGPGPWCGERARQRLLVAAGFSVAALSFVGAVAVRTRRT